MQLCNCKRRCYNNCTSRPRGSLVSLYMCNKKRAHVHMARETSLNSCACTCGRREGVALRGQIWICEVPDNQGLDKRGVTVYTCSYLSYKCTKILKGEITYVHVHSSMSTCTIDVHSCVKTCICMWKGDNWESGSVPTQSLAGEIGHV